MIARPRDRVVDRANTVAVSRSNRRREPPDVGRRVANRLGHFGRDDVARRDAHRRRVLSRRGVRIVLEQRRETFDDRIRGHDSHGLIDQRIDLLGDRSNVLLFARAPPDPSGRAHRLDEVGRGGVHGLTPRRAHERRASERCDRRLRPRRLRRPRSWAARRVPRPAARHSLATQRSSMICSVRSVTRMSRGRPASIAARRRRRCCRCECDSCRGVAAEMTIESPIPDQTSRKACILSSSASRKYITS